MCRFSEIPYPGGPQKYKDIVHRFLGKLKEGGVPGLTKGTTTIFSGHSVPELCRANIKPCAATCLRITPNPGEHGWF